MILTCLGHAKFLLELESGMRIITDPYDASCGYPVTDEAADVVLVSHQHHDHSAVETVPGHPQVIDQPGEYILAPQVKVTAIPAWHDDQQGALRGATLLFLLEAEGLRVAHLGDLGHIPDQTQQAQLGPVDVLMLPVGGFYTIDAYAARETAQLLQARVILPMHYRTSANADWPITPVETFLNLFEDDAEQLSLLRVCKGDLACQPQLAVLMPSSLYRK